MNKCYVHLYVWFKDAVDGRQEYVNKNKEDIKTINTVKSSVICKNGDVHYFLSRHMYSEWCKGRTYILDGELYHSDYKVKEVKGVKI